MSYTHEELLDAIRTQEILTHRLGLEVNCYRLYAHQLAERGIIIHPEFYLNYVPDELLRKERARVKKYAKFLQEYKSKAYKRPGFARDKICKSIYGRAVNLDQKIFEISIIHEFLEDSISDSKIHQLAEEAYREALHVTESIAPYYDG